MSLPHLARAAERRSLSSHHHHLTMATSTPVGTGTGTSSPMKITVNGVSQHQASRKKAVDLRAKFAEEMIGYWGGAMDPLEFLRTQLVVGEPLPKKFNANFKKVLKDVKVEDDMYEPFVSRSYAFISTNKLTFA